LRKIRLARLIRGVYGVIIKDRLGLDPCLSYYLKRQEGAVKAKIGRRYKRVLFIHRNKHLCSRKPKILGEVEDVAYSTVEPCKIWTTDPLESFILNLFRNCTPRCHSPPTFVPNHSCTPPSRPSSISTNPPPATKRHFPFISRRAAMVMALATSSGTLTGRPAFVQCLRRVGEVNVVSVSPGAMAEICEFWSGKICDDARRNPMI